MNSLLRHLLVPLSGLVLQIKSMDDTSPALKVIKLLLNVEHLLQGLNPR